MRTGGEVPLKRDNHAASSCPQARPLGDSVDPRARRDRPERPRSCGLSEGIPERDEIAQDESQHQDRIRALLMIAEPLTAGPRSGTNIPIHKLQHKVLAELPQVPDTVHLHLRLE